MLFTIIIVLVILWAVGFFGYRERTGSPVHALIVIAGILLILRLLGLI